MTECLRMTMQKGLFLHKFTFTNDPTRINELYILKLCQIYEVDHFLIFFPGKSKATLK